MHCLIRFLFVTQLVVGCSGNKATDITGMTVEDADAGADADDADAADDDGAGTDADMAGWDDDADADMAGWDADAGDADGTISRCRQKRNVSWGSEFADK